MYGTNLKIKGALITNGLGCQADDGNGRGYPSNQYCGGSGGAYGGLGGPATNILPSGEIYESALEYYPRELSVSKH